MKKVLEKGGHNAGRTRLSERNKEERGEEGEGREGKGERGIKKTKREG